MTIKRGVAAAVVVGAFAMIWASAAWACTSLASLNLSSGTGQPGSTITLNGSSFSPDPGPIQSVVVHWNGIAGPVLTTLTPDAAGTISGTVTIPQADPGYYVIVATQTDGKGGQAFGTPARAGFTIHVPGASAAVTPVAPGIGAVPTSSSTSGGLVALTIALGVAGLALFGAGAGAFARQARRREVPSAETIKKN
ncbi:MAG TPA: hypothetical protein VHU17_19855 [Acidimicrobiales bacterium]|nr:hypothetical protein [Acidimicrobiales bacterium]